MTGEGGEESMTGEGGPKGLGVRKEARTGLHMAKPRGTRLLRRACTKCTHALTKRENSCSPRGGGGGVVPGTWPPEHAICMPACPVGWNGGF